ncbi:MAG: hypothetical protein NTV16_01525 [Actinobacteria bacterium]|nr:hypothetical protein [Actinomycetota bacterium]
MEYQDILKAIRDYSELVEASSQKFNSSLVFGTMGNSADFEEVICNYVDALTEIKRIRNRNKRWCLVYESLGYEDYMIAEVLRINQSTVSRDIKWLKRFFNKSA